MQTMIDVVTKTRNQWIDITKEVNTAVGQSGVKEGMCFVFVPHTTAAVTINENADPTVPRDVVRKLEDIIPFIGDYQHLEGNSDAHIKAILVGSSVSIPLWQGKLALGVWQGIFFCEFDGPRNRKVRIIVSGS